MKTTPNLQCYVELERYDKKCRLISKSRKKISRSFVKAFASIIWQQTSQTAGFTLVDTGGTTRTLITNNYDIMSCWAAGASAQMASLAQVQHSVETLGIVIGTGTNAVTTTDSKLQTIIANGVSSGQMNFFGTYFDSDVTVAGSSASFIMERIFRNSSGGSITVNEIGVYAYNGPSTWTFCLIRDIVGGGQIVADGEYLKVKYTLQITV